MKKPVICICANPQPIRELFYMLRKRFSKTVAARLSYNEEQKQLAIQLKSKVENPTAIVCYETPLEHLSPIAFDFLLKPLLQTEFNRSGCTVKNAQLLIGTYQKPLLSVKQEKQAYFYDIPENANANVLQYFFKIIWLDLNSNTIPALSLCSVEGQKLTAYYENRKAYYRKRIEQFTAK